MRYLILTTAMVAALAAGCVVRARGVVVADPPIVFYEEPALVPVDADVYVVGDYPVAVYYVGGVYWHYRAGAWYRASSWSSGWTVVDVRTVPTTIVHRDHGAYAHYHGRGARARGAAPNVPAYPAAPHKKHHPGAGHGPH
ncbi:MAG: hypothetical protein IT373_25250 [Polyangiaceae bacterium]|nr:hypothetical protein [Polyangiaceae bacterium]